MAYHLIEDLEVWKRSCNLAVYVYESLQENKDFGLRGQMQRASVSVPSNIAEGSERSPKNFKRFLRIARGSAAELRTQTYIAFKVSAIRDESTKHIVDETKTIARMITALIKSLKTDN